MEKRKIYYSQHPLSGIKSLYREVKPGEAVEGKMEMIISFFAKRYNTKCYHQQFTKRYLYFFDNNGKITKTVDLKNF